MKQLLRATAVGALALLAVSAQAQFPGQGPGGFRPPPGGRAWQTWHDTHRNVLAVGRTLAGLEAIERGPGTRLTHAQAKTVLAVLAAWHARPVMTDTQARQVNRQLTAVLTASQAKEISTSGGSGGRPPDGGFGGPPPGGRFGGPPPRWGRPPGPPPGPPPDGPGGPPPGAFSRPRDYNPLNASTIPFDRARPRVAHRLAVLTAALKTAR